MMIALTIIHVVICLALILVVLMQHGKQQGLSGAIAGGAETFFGKNKGRTIDAMLKKFTSVIAVLFIISSIAFTAAAVNTFKGEETAVESEEMADSLQVSLDEEGNLVDAEGNIVMTADQVAEAEAAAAEEGEAAPTEGEAPADAE